MTTHHPAAGLDREAPQTGRTFGPAARDLDPYPDPDPTVDTHDRDVQLLRDTARRHIGRTAARVTGCLTAAADELADPLRPPALFDLDEQQAADITAVCTAVRARLLDPARPGTVAEHLSRGRAARELNDALQQLADTPPAAAESPRATAAAPATSAVASAGAGAAGAAGAAVAGGSA